MQRCNSLKSRSPFVGDSPLAEQDVDFLPHFGVDHVVPCKNTQTLEKWLIGKCFLESCTRILDQGIQYDQRPDLAMYVSILPEDSLALYIRGMRAMLTASFEELELLPWDLKLVCE